MKNIIRPNVASFLVTEDCNLGCLYCFEKHKKKKMTKEVARQGLEFLANNAILDGVNYFSAMLFGGEPLLEPEIVEEILSYGYELGRKKNLNFSASMVTNATLMNDQIYNIIKTWKDRTGLEIQLSIDGKQETQDMYRITKGGKGSFAMVEKNVPIFQELYKNNPKSLSIHGVVSKNTLPNLYENYKFFHDVWNFERIWFLPVIEESWTEEDVKIYDEQNGKIIENILGIIRKTKNIQEIYNYAPTDRCTRNATGFPSAPCGAGKSFVTITAEGDVYPCHQIYFNDPEKETYIGNVFEGLYEPNRKLFLEYESGDLSCPKDCDHYHCYRCIAVNWMQTGSILIQPQGLYCKMQKVDQKYQRIVRKELEEMGLLKPLNPDEYKQGNNPANPACLCDSRGGGENGCDVVKYEDACLCNINTEYAAKEGSCGCSDDCDSCGVDVPAPVFDSSKYKKEKPPIAPQNFNPSLQKESVESANDSELVGQLSLGLSNLISLNKILMSQNSALEKKVEVMEQKLDFIIQNIN